MCTHHGKEQFGTWIDAKVVLDRADPKTGKTERHMSESWHEEAEEMEECRDQTGTREVQESKNPEVAQEMMKQSWVHSGQEHS